MLQQVFLRIWKARLFVLKYALLGIALGLALAFLIPARYTSTARVIPPQQYQSPLGTLLSQLGAAGLAGLAGLRNPAELYVHLLRSDTIALALSQRFDLAKHYDLEKFEDIHDRLEGRTQVRAGRDGVVIIRVTDAEPNLAASLANGYVEELQKLVQKLTVEEASQRKRFLESKLLEVKKSLEGAEVAFRTLQETTGAIKIDGQVEGTFAAMGNLRANIAMKEVALRALGTSATKRNPSYQTMEAELGELKAQLQKLEQTPQTQSPQFLIAAQRAPKLGLEYLRRLRDVKYEEAMYQVILRQYELARMEETRDFQHIQVVDKGRPATKRNFPSQPMIVFFMLFIMLFVAVFLVLAKSARQPSNVIEKNPVSA